MLSYEQKDSLNFEEYLSMDHEEEEPKMLVTDKINNPINFIGQSDDKQISNNNNNILKTNTFNNNAEDLLAK